MTRTPGPTEMPEISDSPSEPPAHPRERFSERLAATVPSGLAGPVEAVAS